MDSTLQTNDITTTIINVGLYGTNNNHILSFIHKICEKCPGKSLDKESNGVALFDETRNIIYSFYASFEPFNAHSNNPDHNKIMVITDETNEGIEFKNDMVRKMIEHKCIFAFMTWNADVFSMNNGTNIQDTDRLFFDELYNSFNCAHEADIESYFKNRAINKVMVVGDESVNKTVILNNLCNCNKYTVIKCKYGIFFDYIENNEVLYLFEMKGVLGEAKQINGLLNMTDSSSSSTDILDELKGAWPSVSSISVHNETPIMDESISTSMIDIICKVMCTPVIHPVKLVTYSTNAINPNLSIMDSIVYCARVSNPASQEKGKGNVGLIRYLMKHKHWSPFEMANICLEIKTTRDIGRQIIRHRTFSFQEFSQRYAEVPELICNREARLQDQKNRQNSIVSEDDLINSNWIDQQQQVKNLALQTYKTAIDMGIAKEQARALLPEGLAPTCMYMNGSIRSWIHYIEVRTGPETQKEHRIIAQECAKAISEVFPEIMTFCYKDE